MSDDFGIYTVSKRISMVFSSTLKMKINSTSSIPKVMEGLLILKNDFVFMYEKGVSVNY